MLFFMCYIGVVVAVCFFAKVLAVSKILRIPLELTAYQYFSVKVERITMGLFLVFCLPVLLWSVVACVPRPYVFMLLAAAVVMFGISSLSFLCPRCGKFLGFPIRGVRSALDRLTAGCCPKCGFSFDESLCPPPGRSN